MRYIVRRHVLGRFIAILDLADEVIE